MLAMVTMMVTVPGFENAKATTGRDFLNPKVNGLQEISSDAKNRSRC